MINNYVIKEENKEEVLYLYLDFSLEIGRFSGGNLFSDIGLYLKKVNFKGTKVMLMVSGIVISTLYLSPVKVRDDKLSSYVDNIILYDTPNQVEYDIKISDKKTEEKVNDKDYQMEEKKINDNNSEVIKEEKVSNVKVNEGVKEDKRVVSLKEEVPIQKEEKKVSFPNNSVEEDDKKNLFNNEVEEGTKSSVINNKVEEETEPMAIINEEEGKKNELDDSSTLKEAEKSLMVNVNRADGTVLRIALDDYLIGVVGAEMPASFKIEALKAQAVVVRTYTMKRLEEGKVLTDTDSTQVYKDEKALHSVWGSSYDKYYNKIKEAVNETQDEVILYNGYYIDAVYHSTSNGLTENSQNIWGYDIPYLKSVDSYWDLKASSFYREMAVPIDSFFAKLGINSDLELAISYVYNDTKRVDKVIINEIEYTGRMIREIFGLRSTDFEIIRGDETIIFRTKGYGHGVGMSQYGASLMANEGYNYRDIINHYYTNVKIDKK